MYTNAAKFLITVLLLTSTVAATADEPADRLGAVGIGVADLERSSAYYRKILDLEVMGTYELGHLREIVLGWPESSGAVLVLMHWPGQERTYDGNNVKNVFYVSDPKAVIERIRALGYAIDREALPHDAVDGLLVGLARDPDNYVVEVIEK